ncbi:NADH dehydrogenase [Persephonella hydrogeniphila]|uniref:NADH dehydrogenase n=1 Tax=Persephonella hydrogeniphila TaxID=198703 RepID=A0A285N170_9AQUI|nr:complex I NDUFA9 subunit family protein [Persephonella hydrogeniphila]SNZ02537.1 NADH dehydrogenase [Persephonella hydrogeniphila]
MKLFITGGTGFVGSYVVDDLERDFQIVMPVRTPQKIGKRTENVHIIDFSENLSRLIKEHKPDIVINLLGILNENRKKGVTFQKVHVEFVREIVEGAIEAGVQKIIHISALGADINSKSMYAQTKAEGERIVKNSGIDYVILRPSIILGKGQKLFEDLKKFSFLTPIIFAPKGKVQPVHIEDVVETIRKAVENIELKNTVIELCGNRIVSYKELFEFALSYIGKKRAVIEMPSSFFWAMIPIFRLFPDPPITEDQLYLLEKDNICSGKLPTQKDVLGKVRNPFKI